jgi:hypothetical protein
MKSLSLEIKPLKGFGELEFGANPQQVIEYLGEPDDQEQMDDEYENILIFHYDEKDISVFFEEGESDKELVNFESVNDETTLFGKKIFAMKEKEIIALLKEHGYTEMDVEMLEDEDYQNEKRVSFDEIMVDFFFEDEVLTAVSWGEELIFEEEE